MSPKHVLIVDRDGRSRGTITRVLRALGFRVTSVASNVAAGAAMDAKAVDVLILEYDPTDKEAAKLLTRARAAGVPYIFTTDRPELLERLDVPPAHYLQKPVVLKNLVAIVLDYLMD